MSIHLNSRLLLIIVPAVVYGLWVGIMVVPPIVKALVPEVMKAVVR